MAKNDDQDDDLETTVNNLADRYGLKGADRRRFVHGHMTRGGYRAEPTYVRDEEEDEEDGDDEFFSRRRRSQGSGDGSGRKIRKSSGDDWYT